MNSTQNSARATDATLAPLPSLPPVQAGSFPDQDTPFGAATAALAQQWARFGVTVIPSRHIFDGMPAPPPVVNHTGGAVSDADAQRWAVAFNRANALLAWGDANGQKNLRQFVLGEPYLGGPEGEALAGGKDVIWPACSLYPTSMTLYPADATVQSYYKGRGQVTSSRYVFVAALPAGPCEINAKDSSGTITNLQAVPPTLFIQGGYFIADPVLGDIWFSDSGGTCSDSGAPPQLCGRA